MLELALLQTDLGECKVDSATVDERLAAMDAAMMSVMAASADIVNQLEQAAKPDEQYEPAFGLVIDATGVLMQSLKKATAATDELRAAPTAHRW